MFPERKSGQLGGHNEQVVDNSQTDAADEREPQSLVVAANDLLPVRLLELGNSLDRRPDAGNHALPLRAPDIHTEVMHERILHDEAARRHAEDHAEAAPQDEGAGDDGLLGLRRAREDGEEGAGELEALAERRGDEDEQIRGSGEVAAEEAQARGAGDLQGGAERQRPLEAPRPGDGEAGAGAGDGGDERGEDEAQAGRGGAGEEDGLEVEGSTKYAQLAVRPYSHSKGITHRKPGTRGDAVKPS